MVEDRPTNTTVEPLKLWTFIAEILIAQQHKREDHEDVDYQEKEETYPTQGLEGTGKDFHELRKLLEVAEDAKKPRETQKPHCAQSTQPRQELAAAQERGEHPCIH
mmetsp:Transcript_125426/g.216787  ORF Transcript_125426/g.216787 Transcript_125426/m.216787 type:complete len:106 (-) Transcript_125426:283-600(-)